MKKHLPLLFASIWLSMVISGMGLLQVHEKTPGLQNGIPAEWPSQSKMDRAPDEPTLVMFAHPQCPCTRASIGELSSLMTHCQNKVSAWVLFIEPKGMGHDWSHTDLWRSAEEIPGVQVRVDEDGAEANNFHAITSGQVVVYDESGRLLFHGGITESRGHYGDNDGLFDLMDLLNHGKAAVTTPVFGCSLLSPKVEVNTKAPLCAR